MPPLFFAGKYLIWNSGFFLYISATFVCGFLPMFLWGKDTPWSYADLALLWEMTKKNIPPKEIALRLGKSEKAVRAKAQELGITLKEKGA
jgi:hypothetical protein